VHDRGQYARGLDLLRPYIDNIRGGASSQRVRFVRTTWERWLAKANWNPAEIRAVMEPFPDEHITRTQLREIALDATHPEGRRRLLVSTLVWGRGTKNGRMRDPILRLLGDRRLDDCLEETAGLAISGEAALAYNAWDLPGLGEAFFTKWLWAAGSLRKDSPRCLVLDRRVWRSLNEALGWFGFIATGTRRRHERYAAYVDTCHRWASDLGNNVDPEDVEWALFAANGDLTTLA
jgi:hypothetical protein